MRILYVIPAGVTEFAKGADRRLACPICVWSSAVLDGLEVAFGTRHGVGRYQSGAAPFPLVLGLLPAAIGRHTILRASRKLNLP